MEQWDEVKEEFVTIKEQALALEHSLVSISKWESKWHKSFISTKTKTTEESIDYIRCMTLTQNVDPRVYNFLTDEHMRQVSEYIDAPMTATTFSKSDKPPSREIITAELIYYWMIALNIPFECQKWHLNKLFTLINVCNIKNAPPKKMSRREAINRTRSINAARRSASH
jgi:hypothetical protein